MEGTVMEGTMDANTPRHESEWIIKQLGAVNQFQDEATAQRFAAEAKLSLLITTNVTIAQDPVTGVWFVIQALKYLTTKGEQSYALPDVSAPRQ